MKSVAVGLLCVLMTVPTAARAIPQPPPPVSTAGGSMIWSPRIYEGWRIAAVTRLTDGTLKVFVSASHRVQFVTTTSISYGGSKMVYVSYYEVSRAKLTKPAERAGWRDTAAVHKYPSPEFDAMAAGKSVVPSFLSVYTDGTNYLIVVTVIKPLPDVATVDQQVAAK